MGNEIQHLKRMIISKNKLMEFYEHKGNDEAAKVVEKEIMFARRRLKKLEEKGV